MNIEFKISVSGHLEIPVAKRERLKRRHSPDYIGRTSLDITSKMSENGMEEPAREIPVPPPPPPPPPLPIKGESKGLNMWKKQKELLTDPGDQTADVVDEEDHPTGAPGTSYDPKGRDTLAATAG